MTMTKLYDPDEKCDRCSHALKYHRRDSGQCVVASGRVAPGAKARQCWCDAWFPRP